MTLQSGGLMLKNFDFTFQSVGKAHSGGLGIKVGLDAGPELHRVTANPKTHSVSSITVSAIKTVSLLKRAKAFWNCSSWSRVSRTRIFVSTPVTGAPHGSFSDGFIHLLQAFGRAVILETGCHFGKSCRRIGPGWLQQDALWGVKHLKLLAWFHLVGVSHGFGDDNLSLAR